jgi:hypothetical protein
LTREELAREIAITITDLSAKVREAILAGNSGAAVEWAQALCDTCNAHRIVSEEF